MGRSEVPVRPAGATGSAETVGEVVCIIPARSGSQRIPHKNLAEVGGRTLLERAVCTAVAACEHVIVSTDDERYAAVARRFGARVPGLRPAELADAAASTEAVVRHVLERWAPHAGTVCVVQPTSPFTTAGDVRAVLDALGRTPGARSAFTARRLEPAAAFAFARAGDGSARPLAPDLLALRSQDLPELVVPTGNVFAARAADLAGGASLVQWPAAPVVIDEHRALDIDEPDDLEAARRWAEAG